MDEVNEVDVIAALRRELAELSARDEVREAEVAALRAEVAVQGEYIAKLERSETEVVRPKDDHIRNLEAIIAELRGQRARGPLARRLRRR